jgi:acetyltransferase
MKDFFYPKNVVVIGVSEKPTNMGRMIVHNMLHNGFTGQVHAVGPAGGVVLGRPIRKSLAEIPFPLDLAIILTPAATIPGLVRQCGEAGIRRIVIESGGFSELSSDQKQLEYELLNAAGQFRIRFIGPNCIGVINTENGLATPFVLLSENYKLGKVSIISQSGGVAKSYMDALAFEGVHFNKVTSIGNKLNVDESDLLKYFVNEDDGTQIICMYLEGFQNAREFMRIARTSKKPIIVHKAGTGEIGASTAASHTAALSTDDGVVSAAFKQAGIIRVRFLVEMLDFVKIFELPTLKGRNLAIVSRSGGHGVIAADTAEHCGFELPPFPPEELSKINKHVRGGVINLRNPLDLGDLFDLSVYEYIAQMVLSNKQIHGLVLLHGYSEAEKEASRHLMQIVKSLSTKYNKPVAIGLLVNDRERAHLRQRLDFPFFNSPEEAVLALSVSYRSYNYQQSHKVFKPFKKKINNNSARSIVDRALSENRNPSQAECFDILKCYDLPVPDYRTVTSMKQAGEAVEELGPAVVLKIDVPSILHKSEVGGVIMDLQKPAEAREAFREMRNRLEGILKPKEKFAALMMKQVDIVGQEVIFGARQDKTFGPVLMFGLGGIFTEVLGDVSLRVLPAERRDIVEMIRETKGYRALKGARGREPSDIESLVVNLLNLAQLAQDFEEIKEIDLNPVLSYAQGCKVLDARFIF